jgi:uncharacterized phage infection (PIP) family protein YhgE
MVPYRDSMLTRLLAESFGGSSKTCLIITVSTQGSDREETRCSLEFGKRAKLVKNQPEINLEVANDPSPVMQALVAKELGEVQRQREALLQERELLMAERARDQELLRETHSLLQEAATEAMRQQAQRASDVAELEEEKRVIHQKWIYAAESAAETQESSEALLRQLAQERTTLNHQLVQTLAEAAQQESEKAAERARYREADSALRKQLAERQQRAKEYNDHLAQLRQQVQQLRTEKATLQASFQVEEATLRSQWQDHVSRLEEQKAQMAAAFEEQQASLTAAAVDLLSNSVKDQGDRSFDLEEAEARARQVEQEGALLAARCTERKETLSSNLAAAAADISRHSKLRCSRLADLEEETKHLRQRWGHTLATPAAEPGAKSPFSLPLMEESDAELNGRSSYALPGAETMSQSAEDEPVPEPPLVAPAGIQWSTHALPRVSSADFLPPEWPPATRLSATPQDSPASPFRFPGPCR